MLTNEDREYILSQFLDTIAGISDVEYQKRVWLQGIGPECDDFDETVCHFFDDGDPIIEHYKDFGITDEQYLILKKFRDEFEAFTDKPGMEYYHPLFFIEKPEWEHIMKMAKEVLAAFNYPNNKSLE